MENITSVVRQTSEATFQLQQMCASERLTRPCHKTGCTNRREKSKILARLRMEVERRTTAFYAFSEQAECLVFKFGFSPLFSVRAQLKSLGLRSQYSHLDACPRSFGRIVIKGQMQSELPFMPLRTLRLGFKKTRLGLTRHYSRDGWIAWHCCSLSRSLSRTIIACMITHAPPPLSPPLQSA